MYCFKVADAQKKENRFQVLVPESSKENAMEQFLSDIVLPTIQSNPGSNYIANYCPTVLSTSGGPLALTDNITTEWTNLQGCLCFGEEALGTVLKRACDGKEEVLIAFHMLVPIKERNADVIHGFAKYDAKDKKLVCMDESEYSLNDRIFAYEISFIENEKVSYETWQKVVTVWIL